MAKQTPAFKRSKLPMAALRSRTSQIHQDFRTLSPLLGDHVSRSEHLFSGN